MVYVDSSVLLKHYIREKGTPAIKAKLKEESFRQAGVFMAVVGYAEALAVFSRRMRDALTLCRGAS